MTTVPKTEKPIATQKQYDAAAAAITEAAKKFMLDQGFPDFERTMADSFLAKFAPTAGKAAADAVVAAQ